MKLTNSFLCGLKYLTKYLVKYFKPHKNEFVSFIVSANPLAVFRNSIPMFFEYYVEEKFGIQYMFSVLRNPFFESILPRILSHMERGCS